MRCVPLPQLWSPSISKFWNKVCQSHHLFVMLGLNHVCTALRLVKEACSNLKNPKLRWLVSVWIPTWWYGLECFLLVLRAHKLPHLETLLGKERQFYVTVTDGITARKTTAIQSVEQAMEWNEKLNPLWDNCFLTPFSNWKPLAALHIHLPIGRKTGATSGASIVYIRVFYVQYVIYQL